MISELEWRRPSSLNILCNMVFTTGWSCVLRRFSLALSFRCLIHKMCVDCGNVTVLCFKNTNVIRRNSSNSPIMFGPIFLSWDGQEDTYQRFMSQPIMLSGFVLFACLLISRDGFWCFIPSCIMAFCSMLTRMYGAGTDKTVNNSNRKRECYWCW
jgi:hypothetical protein